MKWKWLALVGMICGCVGLNQAKAANGVVVESKTVLAGASSVQIPIRLNNDVAIAGVVVPLIAREISGGAFITTLQISFGDRLSSLSVLDIRIRNQYADQNGSCPYAGFGTVTFNGASPHVVQGPPEGILIGGVKVSGSDLAAGTDASGSMVLTVSVGVNTGAFEIDSTCVNPGNHLEYAGDPPASIVPSFTRGIITVEDNLAPILSPIGPQSVAQFEHLSFEVSASDANLTIPTLTAQDVPASASFVDHLDGTGTFTFEPGIEQSPGIYSVTFFATDGILADTEVVAITLLPGVIPPCFGSADHDTAGISPRAIFSADLDGDGDIDMALANNGGSNVLILKNNGSGGFSVFTFANAGADPNDMAGGDLDGDGDYDLAVANWGSNNVSVLKNDGNGTFSGPANYTVGPSPSGVSVSDLDGDGDLDLAVTKYADNNVSILKNNGDATFVLPTNWGVGSNPYSVNSVDVDDDGDLDLAVANTGGNSVSVLKNNGNGSFSTASHYNVQSQPLWSAAADLDGDGDADLTVTNTGSGSVSILINDGNGVYSDLGEIDVGVDPSRLAVADFDGDGDIDLVVAKHSDDNVTVLRNMGGATFESVGTFGTGGGPFFVSAADFDRDGDLDCAVANEDTWNVSVLLNCSSNALNVVSNTDDAGPGSLRSAIMFTNTNPRVDTITFAVAGQITPSTILPTIAPAVGGTIVRGTSVFGVPIVTINGQACPPGPGFMVGSSFNTIQEITIRDFDGPGIRVAPAARDNTFSKNLIFRNSGLGIDLDPPGVNPNDPDDLDTGANDRLNYPVLRDVFLVGRDSFDVVGTAPPYSTVEVFLAERYLGSDTVANASGHGHAWRFLGSTEADDTGHFDFDFEPIVVTSWSYVTATAIEPTGNTSEFSLNRRLIPDSLIVTVYSPVVLDVITPDALDSIGRNVTSGGFNTIGYTAQYDSLTDYSQPPDGDLDDRVIITDVQPGSYTIRVTTKPGDPGSGYVLGIRVDGTNEVFAVAGGSMSTSPVTNPLPPEGESDVYDFTPVPATRGDLDGSGFVDAVDLAILIDIVFFGAGDANPPDLADINCDGFPDAVDLAVLIDYVFFGGEEPCR